MLAWFGKFSRLVFHPFILSFVSCSSTVDWAIAYK
jgi:hypothetical protein